MPNSAINPSTIITGKVITEPISALMAGLVPAIHVEQHKKRQRFYHDLAVALGES
jgi:hypothetical protein